MKNDAGEITGFQYHVSDADILARTKISYEDPMSLTWEEKKDLPVEKTQYFLKIGRLRFSLGLIDHPYQKFRSESRQWRGGSSVISICRYPGAYRPCGLMKA